ncbi:DUF6804 family protein [Pseudozobellia sp. WGM2]|uniref:DUF6804 family protein n=1 Tax=Pseudozobellia sp. WGM2 TaxID=2787625 RepID=UPI00352E072D
MKYVFKKDINSYISILCAIVLLIATFSIGSSYYRFLRILVFLGAIVIGSQLYKDPFKILCFALIGYLFNPIFPVYLYQKVIWIPIDILTALLFIIQSFTIKNNKRFIPYTRKKTTKSYGRDRKF